MGIALAELMDGLHLRMADGIVTFDRPAAVRHLATAALRGAAGYCLAARRPDLLQRCFKPGQGGSRPPAGLFQPLHDRATTADGFAFRIVTWDPEGDFLPGLAEALCADAPGRPFGDNGARIAAVEIGPIQGLVYDHDGAAGTAWCLRLRTPLCLERLGKPVDADALTLGLIVQATAWRLNLLSEHYGNRSQLDAPAWMAEASLARERRRDLQFVEPKRWSSSQKRGVSLAGVVGEVVVTGLTAEVVALLSTGGVVHVGKHTGEGCGHVLIDPA